MLIGLLLISLNASAQSVGIPALAVEGVDGQEQTYTVTLEILALMTVL